MRLPLRDGLHPHPITGTVNISIPVAPGKHTFGLDRRKLPESIQRKLRRPGHGCLRGGRCCGRGDLTCWGLIWYGWRLSWRRHLRPHLHGKAAREQQGCDRSNHLSASSWRILYYLTNPLVGCSRVRSTKREPRREPAWLDGTTSIVIRYLLISLEGILPAVVPWLAASPDG